MPNRPFFPPPWQIPVLLDGRATLVVTPLKPQPTMLPGVSPRFSQLRAHRHGTDTWMLHGSREASKPFKLPFAPGDTLVCREGFRIDVAEMPPIDQHGNPRSQQVIVYRAGDPEFADEPSMGWQSPIMMTAQDVRLRLRVTYVEVKRVTELTEDEMRECGIRGDASGPWGCEGLTEDFSDAWDAQHTRKCGLAFSDGPWVAVGRVERAEG